MDVFGNQAVKGAQVGLWSANGGNNQVWLLEPTN